ncbi:hypothetical protein [Leisingera sp. S232]|uniref:hypothetical protein n=1 Tax=Leisingera sp. S232 TaxID=3415132 RepID=UPI003C7DC4C9
MDESAAERGSSSSKRVAQQRRFDRYFTHRFAELLANYLKREEPSDEIIELLLNAGVTLKLTLKLLAEQRDRPFRTIRNKVQPELFYLTTQQTKEIDKLFKKVGLHNLTDRVCKKSKKKRLRDRVNKAVYRRHSIAHEADLHSHHKVSKLSVSTVELWLDALEEFVSLSDGIIATEMKKKK